MRSSFAGLELSKRSIQVAQKALDVTGQNLSNASTEGYTRQRVDTSSLYLSTYKSWQTPQAKLSLAAQGVTAHGVAQVRDDYIDKRYRDITCYVSEYDIKSSILTEVQTTLDCIENRGLDAALADFETALTQYATNAPDNVELASIVRNEAFNIATMLNSYSTDLDRLLEDNVFELETAVSNVNILIGKITAYNEAILKEYKSTEFGNIEAGESVSDYGPLALLDSRNLLLDELAQYGNTHVDFNHDGTVKVKFGSKTIIDGSESMHLVMHDYDDYGAAVINFSDGDRLDIISGEIKGYMDIVNGNGPYSSYYQSGEYGIPYYKSAIDAFAEGFADLLNTANGVVNGDESRAMFGSVNDKYDSLGNLQERGAINASTIRISEEWMRDPTMIGMVQNAETGAWAHAPNLDGTHSNQLLLAMQQPVKFGRAGDFEGSPQEYILFLSNRLGQNISFLESSGETAYNTAMNLLDNRDAVSGVSDTEEGINMMTYQKWFNASSRMMTTLDECLDRVINNMGRVGL